jgi:hypothetical protein
MKEKHKIRAVEKSIKKSLNKDPLLNMRAGKFLNSKKTKYLDDSPDEDADEDIDSVFTEHAEKLKKLRKSGLADEAYDIEELNILEELILDLMPIAEDTFRKTRTHTSASAVNNFVTTLTNLQADRRALQNLTARADRLTSVFDQSFEEMTRMLITSTSKLQKDLSDKSVKKDPSELFKDFLRSLGKDLSNIKDMNNNKILQLMSPAPKK